MKKNRNLIIAFVILCIIAAFFYNKSRRSGTISNSDKNFAVKDTASINKIFLADKAPNKVLLERKSSGEWMVNGKFKARPDAINNLLKTIMLVEFKEPVSKAAFSNTTRVLASGSTKVEIYVKDKLEKTYYVGQATQDNAGTFMLMEGSNFPMITHIPGFIGYLSGRYIVKEADWRDRTVFGYAQKEIKSVKVEFVHKPESSYQIKVEDNDNFSLKSLKYNVPVPNFDIKAVKEYLTNYKNIQFQDFDFSELSKWDSLNKSIPQFIISVEETGGKTNKFRGYLKEPPKEVETINGKKPEHDLNLMYGIINDQKEIVIIQNFVFDNLLLELNYFETDPLIKKFRDGKGESERGIGK